MKFKILKNWGKFKKKKKFISTGAKMLHMLIFLETEIFFIFILNLLIYIKYINIYQTFEPLIRIGCEYLVLFISAIHIHN